MVSLRVNGTVLEADPPVGRTLAETLRDDLGLTGTKIACGEGHCGACTVQLDGVPVLSCITLVHTVGEREVTTIEGLRDHPLVDAFVRADALARLVDRYDTTLIIAHAGIADLAALAGHFSGRRGVFFDTSVWSPLDLLDLYRLVSPEQVLYASDYPYGSNPSSLLVALRTARLSGLDEPLVRELLGGSAKRIMAGEPPLEPTPPRGPDDLAQPITFARIHQYLSMATPLLWTRQADTIGVLGLALNACDERSNGYREETERIRELLLAARDLWRAFPEAEDEAEKRRAARTAFRLLHLANIITVTAHA